MSAILRYPYYARLWLLLTLLLVACGQAAPAPDAPPVATPDSAAETAPPTANLTDRCVENYDPEVDYFPDKIRVEHAEGWTIAYFNNYKVVTVLSPWQDADTTFQYVLVQCGTPAPEGFAEALVLEVPARSIVTMSTTYLAHLAELGLVDRLVGVDNPQFANTPEVVERVASGDIVAVGSGADVNIERVLELDPALVMAFGTGSPQNDVHPRLLEAGLPVVLNAEYLEPVPLGRAEWIKFTAVLFNAEAAANTFFDEVASDYNDLAARASAVEERPTVLVNAPFQGTWYVPGGDSFPARLFADAGADYIWAEDATTGSLPLDFEAVFERAADADFWVNTGTWTSIDEALDQDERFSNFAAVQRGTVYNNNARVNENGGNAYWESGIIHPNRLLADLVAIFHPELLPNHDLYYYQQLDP